jgi:AcrR family transcriptional regulator
MAPSVTTRTRMTAAERREQLLDVTKAIVGEEGFHGVSIEGVARRAGITRPVVYGHFADLGALLEAMVERESARALAQLAEVLPAPTGASDPREALLGGLKGYLEAVAADPVTWRLVLMPPEGAPEVLREHITRGREAVVALLARVVGAEGLPGGQTPPDPTLTARLLSATADELARMHLEDPQEYPIGRLIGQARWFLELVGER